MKLTAKGEPNCTAKLLPQLYSELRHPAAQRLARERPGRTLQATALVREAWLRLDHTGNHRWNGRAHFFAAAEAMRRILADNARRKQRVRHGGDCERGEMDDLEIAAPLPDDDLWCSQNEIKSSRMR